MSPAAVATPERLREVTRQPRVLVEQASPRGKGIYRVILLREGPGNPRDKHFYTAKAIQRAPHLFEGLPCFADHPDAIEEEARPERSVRDMVGWYEHVDAVIDRTTGKMAMPADLVTIPGPSVQWVRDLLDAALLKKERTPQTTELVGLSINATGSTEPMNVGGEEWHAVQDFVEAKSCDLVTQAGAGGRIEALKEAMAEGIREGMMSALQVKRAASSLRSLRDPALASVIDTLDKVHADLTHEHPERGKAMPKTAEAKPSTLKRPLSRVVTRTAEDEDEDEDEAKARTAKDEDEDEAKASEDEGAMATELERRVRQLERRVKAAYASEAEDEGAEDEDEEEAAAEAALMRWGRKASEAEEVAEDEAAGAARIKALERRVKTAERKLGIVKTSEDEDGEDYDDDDEDAPADDEPTGAGKPGGGLAKRGSGEPGDHDTYHGDVTDKGHEFKLSEDEDEGEEEARASEDAIPHGRVRIPKVALRHGRGTHGEAQEAEELPAAFMPKRKKATERKKASESLAIPSTMREAVALQVYRHTKASQPTRTTLMVENAKLRAELAVASDRDQSVAILRESGLPRGAWPWLLRQIFGQPKDEKRRIVDAFREAQLALAETTRDEEGPGPRHAAIDGESVEEMTDRLAQFDVPLTPLKGRA